MVIRVESFAIKYSEGFNKFDLFRVFELKSGDRSGEEVERPEAYGVSLQRCCHIIADFRAKENLEEIDLQTYVDQFKKIIQETFDEIDKQVSVLMDKK